MKVQNEIPKKSEATNKTLLDMLSIISHNVKGPIKYIQFITDYNLEHWENAKPEELRECAQIINESARDIANLLANMMHWASLQKEELTKHNSKFDLHAVISDEIALHRTAQRLKKLTIENWIPKGSIVKTDAHILRLAFQNILSNAIKFSFANSRIWIEYKENDKLAQISIQDEGKGMSPEELENLMNDEFFSSLGTMEERGTGLGTALTKKLAELLGGYLTMESQLDAGTKVTLHLPV